MNLYFTCPLPPHGVHSIACLPVAETNPSAPPFRASPTPSAPPSSFAQAIGGAASQPAEIPPATSQPAPGGPVALKGWAQIV